MKQIKLMILAHNKKTLFQLLSERGISIRRDCLGKGTCHSCEVDFTVNNRTTRVLSCQFRPSFSTNIEALIDFPERADADISSNVHVDLLSNSALCVDIGTTTIAMAYKGQTHVFTNPQRTYGCDILSRMEASNTGKRNELKDMLISCIEDNMSTFVKEQPEAIYICGNTTMIHLLLGYTCNTLSKYPFKPFSLRQIITSHNDVPVYIIPAASSFIGGDIISGLYYLQHQLLLPENYLFIDLGTNGEMVMRYNGQLMATSTAAGPALEGGNLSCGIASIPGAIHSCRITGSRVIAKTIDDRAPIGLCGSGAISLLSELKDHNLIDKTGLLAEEYRESGYPVTTKTNGDKIYLTMKDIRNLQLALAAISAGILTLLSCCHASASSIDHIYIAGGLGYELNLDAAISLGLFPSQWAGKITPVGNTSLGGLTILAANQIKDPKQVLPLHMESLYLADHAIFRDAFIHKLEFLK